ncbi:MAG: carbohydrate ABC transporter permease [Paenibacillaceae bacterium]|nr:carbohydrate ABC transporter permease [Paenibacillaceae bacterium]
MHRTMTAGEKIGQAIVIAIIVLLCLSILYPFLHLLSVSFSTPEAARQAGLLPIPREWSAAAYRQAFAYDSIWIGYGNTVLRTVAGTFLSLVVMTATAYALSKKTLPHRRIFTLLIVFTLFFNGGLIPTFLLIRSLGLIDSRLALILPMLISTFSLLIMRNYFMTLPAELEESARMDGANDIRILAQIIVPLSKPILATITLWTAVAHWNAWFDALLYIQSPGKMVLQLFLRRLLVENQMSDVDALMRYGSAQQVSPDTVKAAVLFISTVPIMAVYPFIQKYFVQGIMAGSLKG